MGHGSDDRDMEEAATWLTTFTTLIDMIGRQADGTATPRHPHAGFSAAAGRLACGYGVTSFSSGAAPSRRLESTPLSS